MKISLNGKSEATKWETVNLPNGDTFDVKLKRPNYDAQLRRHAHHVAVAKADAEESVQAQIAADMHAIQATIVDWRGVINEADDKPIPFSVENLLILVSQANCSAAILNLAYSAFGSAFDETPAKNFDEPRSEPSAAAT